MKYLIIGATSAIAQAYARRVADGNVFVLVGRSHERLEAVAADLRSHGAVSVQTESGSAWSPEACINVLKRYFDTESGAASPPDVCLIAQGRLPTMAEEAVLLEEVWSANAVEVSSWIFSVFERMYAHKSGVLAVITSVAGDRGRATNALYGAAKAAVSTLIEALRQRAAHRPNVRLLDIKPGPVDTPMTSFMEKTPLFASPERVACDIDKAIRRGKTGVVYTPWWWRWIMFVIKLLPEVIFHRVSF